MGLVIRLVTRLAVIGFNSYLAMWLLHVAHITNPVVPALGYLTVLPLYIVLDIAIYAGSTLSALFLDEDAKRKRGK